MERKDLELVNKMYPTKAARDAADAAYDALDEENTSIADGLKVWNDAYVAAGGVRKYRER